MRYLRVVGLVALVALWLSLGLSVSSGKAAGSGCPGLERQAPVSLRAGAQRTLVPGSPSAVLLCRYRGLNPPGLAGRLRATRLLRDGATVSRLAREFDALRRGPLLPVPACPADTGLAIVAWFRYRGGPPDPVRVGLDGCMSATNGHAFRLAGVQARGRALVAELEALVPAPVP